MPIPDSSITETTETPPRHVLARQRRAVQQLFDLNADRAEAEQRIKQTYADATDAVDQQYAQQSNDIARTYKKQSAAAQSAYDASIKKIDAEYDANVQEAKTRAESARLSIVEKGEDSEAKAKKRLRDAIWTAETVYEATEDQPDKNYDTKLKELDGLRSEITSARERAETQLRKYRQKLSLSPTTGDGDTRPPHGVENGASVAVAAREELIEAANVAQRDAAAITAARLPRFMSGIIPFVLVVVIAAAAGTFAARKADWQLNNAVYAAIAIGFVSGLLLLVGVYMLARRSLRTRYQSVIDAEARAESLRPVLVEHAEQIRDDHKKQLIETRDRDVAAAKERYEPILKKVDERRQHHFDRIERKRADRLQELEQRRDAATTDAERERDDALSKAKQTRDAATAELEAWKTEQTAAAEATYKEDWDALEQRWTQGMADVHAVVDELRIENERRFPTWDDPAWEQFSAAPRDHATNNHALRSIVRFGGFAADLEAIPGGLPDDDRLKLDAPDRFDVPALLELPEHASVLLRTKGDGRDEAIDALRTIMLRLITTLPPGKVRFTIIDPVALGQNFAGYMHLADYDPQLITDRIWTEAAHIEQRLVDLTEHMETVIQKYLRNEFETIAEYNEQAGEIAEPYRFLVISDFPANFSDEAARRLASIVNSGARCGVYTLIHHDMRQPLPGGIDADDIAANSALFETNKEGQFVWMDDAFSRLPLTFDPAPDETFVSQITHAVGQLAKDSSRVEVPFRAVAPPEDQRWTSNTAEDIRVPLGRTGATKLQYLELGHGTRQHALIAGKTGSGKSTLLHVLITNLGLWYSPDEVELYLVDFKKGVEFKTYAAHDMPHARVIAIESDREFGLSVLQKLDGELRRRGAVFRDLGVQGLPGYRKLLDEGKVDKPMPRLMLIIDEFQEFFVDDDKLGQDAALLLDRLVRQGRAFGMHVLLGSQTLGGAYSLARSTLGQMGVRIALQCSEADSYLILSEDNAAARLLSRPGEAIYNDASGLLEGNSPFQTVWLDDAEREEQLKTVRDVAELRDHPATRKSQIVFEGNVPAKLERNDLLRDVLHSDDTNELSPQGWLGDAIAIKDPTAATFRRQSGANLLIVGQRDESALAMMSSCLIGLAAQTDAARTRFIVLDGSPPDAPHAGYLAGLDNVVPHDVKSVNYREVDATINEIASLVAKRQDEQTGDSPADAPSVFVFVYGLQRFRSLRHVEDFSYSYGDDGDKPPAADKQFAAILREGPTVGVHTLCWCDTAANLARALDRQTIREFELRVLFQMSATDSTTLIDTPEASRLGLRRAVFSNEEQGLLEKFRPYALPDAAFLDDVRAAFDG